MLLASDDNNREFVGARNPDDVLWVQFYTVPTRNEKLSLEAGSAIFVDEVMVRIMIPGRNDLTIDRPLEPSDPHRFRRQWSQFQSAQEGQEQLVGTPVAEWPIITRAQAEELRSKRFYTVQQIAQCSDDQIASLGMNANSLRIKARAFVQAAQDTALAQIQAVELRSRDDKIAALTAQVQELASLVKAEKPGKPGRKPMSDEAKAAAGARLKAAREAKKAAAQAQPEV